MIGYIRTRGRSCDEYLSDSHEASDSGCRILSDDMAISTTEDVRFHPASDQSLLVYLGNRITLQAHERVAKLLRLLESEPIPGVRNLHPAYCSLLVKFDALRLDHARLEAILRGYLDRLAQVALPPARERGNTRLLRRAIW